MRKIEYVTITAEGRDLGKVFVLHEMFAGPAEWWAVRLFLSMAKSGVEVPDDVAAMGLAGIATLGMKALAGISLADAKPLLDEMFSYITIRPDPTKPDVERNLVESDIEELATRFKLRKDLWDLQMGFSLGVALSTMSPATPTGANSSNTQTFHAP